MVWHSGPRTRWQRLRDFWRQPVFVRVDEGYERPRYYGLCWIEWYGHHSVWAIMPLHLFVATARAIRNFIVYEYARWLAEFERRRIERWRDEFERRHQK